VVHIIIPLFCTPEFVSYSEPKQRIEARRVKALQEQIKMRLDRLEKETFTGITWKVDGKTISKLETPKCLKEYVSAFCIMKTALLSIENKELHALVSTFKDCDFLEQFQNDEFGIRVNEDEIRHLLFGVQYVYVEIRGYSNQFHRLVNFFNSKILKKENSYESQSDDEDFGDE
jgi:hypothetical protein